jgi:hypothetical protein
MPTFRLSPVAGTENDPAWEASTLKPQECWVSAEDESRARLELYKATFKMVKANPGQRKITKSPWLTRALTQCIPDKATFIPPGMLIAANGRKIDIFAL